VKILYIQQHFATPRGEGGVRGYHLMRTLVARGHDVTVLSGHSWRDRSLAVGRGRWAVEDDRDGFRLVRLGVFYSNHLSFVARLRAFVLFGLLACREVLRRPVDLVLVSSPPLTVVLPALCARWLRRVPYVLEVRDLWPDFPIEMGIIKNRIVQRLLYAFERLAYRHADRLVALAPGIERTIREKAGVPAARVAVLPNASDMDTLRPLPRRSRRHLPASDADLVLGYAGTHGIANGLDAVLDAAAVLKRRGVRDVVFVLIGDGREKPRLVKRAAAAGLDNVRFVGLFGKADYGEVLAELDVGLQILLNVESFRWSTSPNKFFDYLAAGKPVLVNYPGWVAGIVTAAGCGVAVPPDDPEAFADAVERLLGARARLPEMGVAARALAESRFSQSRILEEVARFLESAGRDMAAGRPAPARQGAP
jgi:glycosyltransferase involved in cell wall biosynthesis